MLGNLKELYCLLTGQQRRQLLSLQVLVVLMAFAEVAGVVAIGPFMAMVGDISRLQGDGLLAQAYLLSGASSPNQFLFWCGIAVLGILALAAAVSMYTVWRLSLYGHQLGAELSIRLYNHYMRQPWLFHSAGSSADLTNKIVQECNRITDALISPLMQMNAKIGVALCMILVIVLLNPLVALVGVCLFLGAYLLLYRTVRQRLDDHGDTISATQQLRFKLMAEGFGGIKDVLLTDRQPVFINRFESASRRYGRAKGLTKALSQAPRYAMELVAYGAVILLVLYLLASHHGQLGTILPLLSVYALAGFKLLPALQQIYASVSIMRGNLAAFDALRMDLYASREEETAPPTLDTGPRPTLVPRQAVELCHVTFRYRPESAPALHDVSLRIPAHKVIGLVGASGSGKSTAIDLLLGLITPEQGELRVDGEPLAGPRRRAWQNSLGFVPQAIFLADASIRENIAFGLPPEQIDEARVRRAARMAHLDELLIHLPDGLETRVGERGIQLSGGQRQRIGIARALYDDAEVLILDEATSALDGITEKLVMDAIHDFSGKKTIIMIAHRLATVRQCDAIYMMEAGRIVDHGTYDELVERNSTFQRMARHS
ncbi:ABC transporter ATP-binding protein [Halomonas mongoliensis]|uniref:ABC transporter ATP-binding protein n=1 Tax=Halomonas mongoliensis TaxID=321265 RepID=A0ABU1GK53_9GAMM|nr:ABC transporter ATP-binding protein [Halomonas mongoliensis]MDR5891927.1 ABC transporter ATP-binding protein [Halomonas mongoliensis]